MTKGQLQTTPAEETALSTTTGYWGQEAGRGLGCVEEGAPSTWRWREVILGHKG